MKAKFSILGLLLLCAALSSCSVMENAFTSPRMVSAEADYNATWQGRKYADIIRTYGAPQRSVSDGQGGMIHIYENCYSEAYSSGGMMMGPFYPDYTTTISNHRDYVEFYMNANDVCYMVKTNYLKQDGREFNLLKSVASSIVIAAIAELIASPLFFGVGMGYGSGFGYGFYY